MMVKCDNPRHPFEHHYCSTESWDALNTYPVTTTEVPLCERVLPAMGTE